MFYVICSDSFKYSSYLDVNGMIRRKKKMSGFLFLIVLVFVASIVSAFLVYFSSQTQKGNFPFPCTNETLAIHVHPWIQIKINGEQVTIPAYIGIKSVNGEECVEPIHTHDNSGIIHIEASERRNYTLGDFFSVWKATYSEVTISGQIRPVIFNTTDLFGFRVDAAHSIIVLVDGKKIDPSNYLSLNLNMLDYCNSTNSVSQSSPCFSSARNSEPYWGGEVYPYGTGHTIVIEYVSNS
jgi:hypothetical protein